MLTQLKTERIAFVNRRRSFFLSLQRIHPKRQPGLGPCEPMRLSRFWRELGHQPGDPLELQPPLFLGALELYIGHPVEVTHVVEYELSVLQADESAVTTSLITFVDKKIEAQACKPRGLNAVEG